MTRLFTNYFRHLATLRSQAQPASDDLKQDQPGSAVVAVAKVKAIHSCPRCERTFNSKYNVVRHLKQFHADKRMFKCDVCGKDYKWIDSLHKHKKTHALPAPQLGPC